VRGGLLLAVALVSAIAGTVRAEEQGASATGSLAWIASDRLDLVGTVAVEIPIAHAGVWRVFTSLEAVTAIERATSNVTFLVDQIGYDFAIGARRPVGDSGTVTVYAGEQGLVLVDAVGRARVRVLGAAWESRDFRRALGPFGWSGRVALAAVFEHHDVSAVATASGEVRYVGLVSPKHRVGLGVEATVDALIGDDGGEGVTVGPVLQFDLSGDRRFGLFARWLHGGNPLGLGTDGVLAGFDFSQGLHADGTRVTPPEFNGACAAGAGDGGRQLARLDLRVKTPALPEGTYAEVDVDASVLSASDLNDLFYQYDVGVAQPIGAWRAGLWFHHRSNHVVNGANPEVTSINVLEGGVESAGWDRAEPEGLEGRWGALDARLRAGWLIDSAFGEDTAWHARGGARWASPRLGATRLYAMAELERGDVAGSAYAVGALLPHGWDLRVAVTHDEQLFSADRRARLAIASLRY